MVLFPHRYTKCDRFIEETQQEARDKGYAGEAIDFSIIRDVMYKYSKRAEDRYFRYETEAFMFAAFALSDEGIKFLKGKPDNAAAPEKLKRIINDLM